MLYLDNCYLKEFDAIVKDVNHRFVVLDQTAFYPNSGGQPHDTGRLIRINDNKEFKVIFVKKFPNYISHEVNEVGLKQGDKVRGIIDFDRRYKLMRNHTAAHILSATFYKEASALITGNQLGIEKSRIDFSLEKFDRNLIEECFEKANEIVKNALPVKIYYITRDEALKMGEITKLAKGLPNLDKIRIVEIEGFDKQADGGTHVRNTKEVGEIELIKCENKGKNNRRIYFRLK